MRISDWSSDVCSSDLPDLPLAALVYVDDTGKGITRKKHRIGWAYFDARGRRIEDAEEIRRLNGIGLPPAYVNCWFCPDPNGHLQAIGYDARGRKQYRYHSAYREAQEERKYDRCLPFVEAQIGRATRGKRVCEDMKI